VEEIHRSFSGLSTVALAKVEGGSEGGKELQVNPMEGNAFLFLWIGFLLLMSTALGTVFLWAIRAGQFANQERARYLALEAAIPDLEPPAEDAPQAKEKEAGPEGRGRRRELP
jgi:cbb3-type cytochrome oxidase maturation protein